MPCWLLKRAADQQASTDSNTKTCTKPHQDPPRSRRPAKKKKKKAHGKKTSLTRPTPQRSLQRSRSDAASQTGQKKTTQRPTLTTTENHAPHEDTRNDRTPHQGQLPSKKPTSTNRMRTRPTPKKAKQRKREIGAGEAANRASAGGAEGMQWRCVRAGSSKVGGVPEAGREGVPERGARSGGRDGAVWFSPVVFLLIINYPRKRGWCLVGRAKARHCGEGGVRWLGPCGGGFCIGKNGRGEANSRCSRP